MITRRIFMGVATTLAVADGARADVPAAGGASAAPASGPAAGATTGSAGAKTQSATAQTGSAGAMYGLVGRMTAIAGRRDELAGILLDGVAGMPGCLSYVIATDPKNADVLWITEAWESRDAHRASLQLPSVREAIGRGRPLIAAMETLAETVPVGGHGLLGA